MVAKLMSRCGLFLGCETDLVGPSESNPDGHWEEVRFVGVNDAVLAEFGSGWDYVPPLRFSAATEHGLDSDATDGR